MKRLLVAGGLLLILVLMGFIPISLSPLREVIRDASYAALGIEIDITGSASIRFGLSPSLAASDIVFVVPEAKSEALGGPLVSIGRLHVRPKLIDIVRGDIYFAEITVDDLSFDYCAPVPVNKSADTDGAELPALGFDYIGITQISAYCGDTVEAGAPPFEITSIYAHLPAEGALTVSSEARIADVPVSAVIESDNLNELLSDLDELPFNISADLAAVRLAMDASLQLFDAAPSLAGQLTIRADDPNWLAGLAGEQLPELGALSGGLHVSADMSGVELSELALDINRFPYLGTAVQIVGGSAAVDFDKKILRLVDAQLALVGNELTVNAQMDASLPCPELVFTAGATDVDLLPLGKIFEQYMAEPIELGGGIGALSMQAKSCGMSLEAHLTSLDAKGEIAGASLITNGEPFPVVVESLLLEAGWVQPVQAEFAGRLLGESATAIIKSGTVDSLLSGAATPLSAQLTAAGAEARFAGQAGLGAAMDAYTAGLVELLNVPVSGDDAFIDGDLSIAGPRTGSLHGLTGLPAESDLPFSLAGRIIVTMGRLLTETFELQIADSDLYGDIDVQYDTGEPVATITARSNRIDLQQLGSLLPESAEADAAAVSLAGADEPIQSIDLDSSFVADELRLPAISVEFLLNEVAGIPLQIQQVNISGQLKEQRVDNARLALLVEETPLHGSVNADLSSTRMQIDAHFGSEDMDINRIMQALGLPGDQSIEVARTDNRISASGSSLREFIQTSRLDIEIESFRWADRQPNGESSFDVDLDTVLVSMAPDRPMTWQSEGAVNKVRINGWAMTPSLYDLIGTDPLIPFRLVIGAGNYTAMLAGTADRGNADFMAANVELSGVQSYTPMAKIAALESPLAGFKLGVDLQAYNNGDFRSKLNAIKGESEIEGAVFVGLRDGRQKIDIELNAPRVQTGDFVQAAQQWRLARETQADGGLESDAAVPASTAPEQTEPDDGNLMLIIDDYINRQVEQRDFDLRLNVADLSAGDNQLGSATLKLQVNQDVFKLDPLQIIYADGEVNASYVNTTRGDSNDAQLDVSIDNLEVGGLLPLLDPALNVNSILYLDAELAAESTTRNSFAENINGEITLMLIPEEVDASILDLWATNLVLALLPSSDSGGDKMLNCMVARFSAEDGILKSKGILLDSTDIIVRGRGSIDIPKQQLDLLAAPQAKRERFFSVATPVRVTGPWDDFQVGVEPGGFIGTMFRWYMALIYVPFKWLTGERFPADGLETCFSELDLEVPPDLLQH